MVTCVFRTGDPKFNAWSRQAGLGLFQQQHKTHMGRAMLDNLHLQTSKAVFCCLLVATISYTFYTEKMVA